ncbi:MAG TPA: hypothetical protein VK324_00375 [Tepidisphaeraceae bacterium]|nr:hypothetical protein [Tepidisphaeraceae bacterium]
MARWLASLAVTGLGVLWGVGCAPKPEPDPGPPPPPPEATYRQIRTDLQQVPGTLVGRVTAARPDVELVSVADLPVSQLRPGDVVSFIDEARRPIAAGSVADVVGDRVHVKYGFTNLPGQRAPRVGDIAVRMR